ncbi:MAG TPA: hypothetical protein VFZ32_05660 [Micromonosporaceae bacterium]
MTGPLAERRLSRTDRRARIIAVTGVGERIISQGQEIIDRIYADVLGTPGGRTTGSRGRTGAAGGQPAGQPGAL